MEKNIMYNYTSEDHRIRLQNIRLIEKNIEKCEKKDLITDYIQGQYVWPNVRFDDFEADEKLLRDISEKGIGLIQIWEHVSDYVDKTNPAESDSHQGEWMYRPYDKKKADRFIELVHKYGMKIIPYTSTNFYVRKAPDFEAAWAMPEKHDLGDPMVRTLAHCSPNSPGWREKILRQYATLLDEYDFDGIYNDTGYIRTADYWECCPYYLPEVSLVEDEIIAFEESMELDGGMQDLLAMIYSEVNRRGKILKLHKEGADRIRSKIKLYDYLWVGEAVESIDLIRERTKYYDAYVIPDFNHTLKSEHERYLNTIPFMQFPVIRSGQSEGANWAGVPDYELQLKWLKVYREMTKYGTWAYIDSSIPALVRPQNSNTVVTVFVNTDIYIIVANYSKFQEKIVLGYRGTEITVDGEGERFTDEITLDGRTMKVLKLDRIEMNEEKEFSLFNTDRLLGEYQLTLKD